jgi:hypothetical protein
MASGGAESDVVASAKRVQRFPCRTTQLHRCAIRILPGDHLSQLQRVAHAETPY